MPLIHYIACKFYKCTRIIFLECFMRGIKKLQCLLSGFPSYAIDEKTHYFIYLALSHSHLPLSPLVRFGIT